METMQVTAAVPGAYVVLRRVPGSIKINERAVARRPAHNLRRWTVAEPGRPTYSVNANTKAEARALARGGRESLPAGTILSAA